MTVWGDGGVIRDIGESLARLVWSSLDSKTPACSEAIHNFKPRNYTLTQPSKG
jgi:hypothetical protein